MLESYRRPLNQLAVIQSKFKYRFTTRKIDDLLGQVSIAQLINRDAAAMGTKKVTTCNYCTSKLNKQFVISIIKITWSLNITSVLGL